MNEFNENEGKEMLKIFDENKKQIGIATREEIHRLGYWHESFHCWFISREEEKDFIYFQLRSDNKKDYPNLLDITAAGHLLAHETILDGTREIREEIGIDVTINNLEKLGVLDYYVERENFIDKEMANVFMYRYHKSFDDFVLQEEEVSGVFRAEFIDFYKLWTSDMNEININGFKLDENGSKVLMDTFVQRDHFVPHERTFYQNIIKLIQQKI